MIFGLGLGIIAKYALIAVFKKKIARERKKEQMFKFGKIAEPDLILEF